MMIPASAEYDVPGADDAAIQADILATLGRDSKTGRRGARPSRAACGKAACATRSGAARCGRERIPRLSGGAAAATLIRVVLQCYYRDDRVLRSLGLELRPPFPKGHVLEQGDWSLLEPVKARPSMWRRAP